MTTFIFLLVVMGREGAGDFTWAFGKKRLTEGRNRGIMGTFQRAPAGSGREEKAGRPGALLVETGKQNEKPSGFDAKRRRRLAGNSEVLSYNPAERRGTA